MTKRLLLLALSITFTIGEMPAMAHHSAAAFDPNDNVDVSGTVAELAWTSPHARLYIDVVTEDGSVEQWNFELPSPVGLMRKGWRRKDLAVGDTVTARGIRAKNGSTTAVAKAVLNSEGNPLFAGK